MPEDILDKKNDHLFNLQETIKIWLRRIKVEHSKSDSDIEELRSHQFSVIDDLKLKGLDDEEAFLIASKRLNIGGEFDLENRQKNKSVLQMRRSLIILGGVLVFFLTYYFIKSTSKALLIAIFSLSDSNGFLAVNWYERILIGWHFIFLVFMTSIFLLEERTVKFIEKIKIKPKNTLYILILTGIFEMVDFNINPIVKSILRYNPELRNQFGQSSITADLSFPILICVGFIFIYYKYYRKTKI